MTRFRLPTKGMRLPRKSNPGVTSSLEMAFRQEIAKSLMFKGYPKSNEFRFQVLRTLSQSGLRNAWGGDKGYLM